jgi:O-antigen ligase/polysaccharide polymerase Wzy-like membrane protein
MAHPEIAQLAAVGGALGSALLLLARGRAGLLSGLVVLAVAEGGLALSVSSSLLDSLGSPAGAAAAVAGLGVLAAAAAVLVRWPGLVPVAVLAAAPFRPPLDFNGSHRFLISFAQDGRLGRLLPLYFVLAASGLALAWRALRAEEMPAIPRTIARPAAAFFAFAFLSLLWADSVKAGVDLLAYFTLPFAVLLGVVARATFPAWLPRALAVVAVALASLFALVGLWQAATHQLFFYAPNLEVSNANTSYFRVTSLFGDPSLYGRHLVLGLGVLLSLLATRRAKPWLALALVVLMWLGLLFSYSQSSMVALVVVTLGIAVATGDRRVRRAAGYAALIAVVVAMGFGGAKLISGGSINQVTSDRTRRVEDTVRVIGHNPVIGVGLGNQARVSRRLAGSERPAANFVSHTTPLTVTAELGVVGLALYVWLLLGGVRLIAEVHRRDEALGLALGVAFLALFVHALFYSGFLEDPVTWVVLGAAAGFLAWRRPAGADVRAAASSASQPAPVAT